MSTLKPHIECLECGRAMRGPRVPASEAPGTVRHVGRGRCITCRDRDRDRSDREIQLCRWLPGDEYRVERPQLVKGIRVAVRARVYVLRIDGVVHEYPRDDWFEVSL